MRRWLWEQFNLSTRFRSDPPPFVRQLWDSSPVPCARSLSATLNRMLREGACDPRDAIAWGQSASLEGRKVSRVAIASSTGLQPRDLHRHLARVDDAIANHVAAAGFEPAAPSSTREAIIAGLVQSSAARIRGSIDEADGFYLAAADLAGLRAQVRIHPVGTDRSSRARVRKRALRTLPLSPKAPLTHTVEDLFVVKSSLEDNPSDAVRQVELAWRAGEYVTLPLLLDHAASIVPDSNAAGPDVRAWLLEIGSNIYRDAESLAALTWTSAWIREATANDTRAIRIAANGRKTRAHVLQLHGFTDAAREEMELAASAFLRLNEGVDDYKVIEADLQIRAVALAVVREEISTARTMLNAIDDTAPAQMRLGKQRYRLHVESMAIARTRQRRSWSRNKSSQYESALDELHSVLPLVPADRRLTVIDTLIGAAMRLGDVNSIRDIVDQTDWETVIGQPNIKYRLLGRLKKASLLPSLADLGDISFPSTEHPLRQRGLLPRALDFMI